MDKYYTPELKEFSIGLEYEYYVINNNKQSEWVKNTLTQHNFSPDDWFYVFNTTNRVKYLDETDLIELGWTKDDDYFKIVEGYYDKEDDLTGFEYNLRIDNFGLYITEYRISYGEAVNYIFQGQVKNKSEMKKLMEMLNIKNK